MCFAVPLKTIKKKQGQWVMEDGRVVKTDMVGEVSRGDFLICRQDMAVDKISQVQALAMRRAIKGVSDELSKGD